MINYHNFQEHGKSSTLRETKFGLPPDDAYTGVNELTLPTGVGTRPIVMEWNLLGFKYVDESIYGNMDSVSGGNKSSRFKGSKTRISREYLGSLSSDPDDFRQSLKFVDTSKTS